MNFNGIEKFYHYTSLDSALKILLTESLLFSKLERMNDINESHRSLFFSFDSNEEDLKKQIESCSQISLTQDSQRLGFNIPAMWGHYASKGYGVCLAFDKSKIQKVLDAMGNVDHKDVKYSTNHNNSIVWDNSVDALDFLKENKDSIFFEKTEDWCYEQEYRILNWNHEPGASLKIGDSLIAVIVCLSNENVDSIFNSQMVKMLKKVTSVPVLQCGGFLGDLGLRDEDGNDVLKENQVLELDI